MSIEGILLVLFFIVIVAIRVPLGISAAIVTLIYLWLGGTVSPAEMVMNSFQALDRFPLLAIPLFILSGQFMATGGIAKYFLNLADEILGGAKGGYALVTILACVFFADLSGSAPATVAAIGTLMIPAMIKQGYNPGFAAAICACAGVISIIIPPSNPMIIYSLVSGASVGKMFLGGFLPGFLLSFGIGLPAYLVSRKHGWGGVQKTRNLRSFVKAFWQAKWALMIPVIILGGIYSGIFTPTESAAVACLYSFIAGLLLYREFKLRDVPGILRAAATPIVTVMVIVVFATSLGTILTIENVPQQLAMSIRNASDSPIVTMLIINLLLLVVGTFMDTMAAIIILAPLLVPIVSAYGISPVHFGLVMIINLGIGFVTPPFGSNLFVANQISGLRIQAVFKSAVPMLLGMIVALLLLTFIPEITMFIPSLFY